MIIAVIRILVIAASLALWYLTQWALSRRAPAAGGSDSGQIFDGMVGQHTQRPGSWHTSSFLYSGPVFRARTSKNNLASAAV